MNSRELLQRRDVTKPLPPNVDMTGRVCVITGASSGIGKATALGLARMGATVLMHGHDRRRSEAALQEVRQKSGNPSIELLLADLSTRAGVQQLASELLRQERLHVLVNNAGVVRMERTLTKDGLEMTFALNHLAYFELTIRLLGLLKASAPARIVNVSSSAHHGATIDFDNLQGERRYQGWSAYSRSKLANILFTYELARQLEATRVTANCLHPGTVATRLMSGSRNLLGRAFRFGTVVAAPFLLSAEQGAATPIYLSASPEVAAVSGRHFHRSVPVRSSEASYDGGTARLLWDRSEQLVGRGG